MKKSGPLGQGTEKLKQIQNEIKQRLRESKHSYRKKLEEKLQRSKARDVWSGMREITGYKRKDEVADGNVQRANELNQF